MIAKQEKSTGYLFALEQKEGQGNFGHSGRPGKVGGSGRWWRLVGGVVAAAWLDQKAKEFDNHPGSSQYIENASDITANTAREKKTKKITVDDAFKGMEEADPNIISDYAKKVMGLKSTDKVPHPFDDDPERNSIGTLHRNIVAHTQDRVVSQVLKIAKSKL